MLGNEVVKTNFSCVKHAVTGPMSGSDIIEIVTLFLGLLLPALFSALMKDTHMPHFFFF